MSQAELNAAVAEATGESIGTIRRRGFSVYSPLKVFEPDENEASHALYLDWDEVDQDRRRAA
jgi:hypothetical protein